jgi:hypothetical protein
MAIGDYLSYLNPTNYNVFGVDNPTYSGLLGPEQSQALSQRSNIAGLLGAAAALAQGMGRQGGRRSAAQNILGALGAGYGASGQAYSQGLQNFSAVQQLKANQDKQKAFADMAIKYPDLAPLARIDPAKFVEMVSQLEQQRPISEAYKQAYGQQAVQQVAPPVKTQADIAYENQLAAVEQDRNLIQQQNVAREQEYLKTLGVSNVANKDIYGQPVALAASPTPRAAGGATAGEVNQLDEFFANLYNQQNKPATQDQTTQPTVTGAELYPVPFEGRQADIAKLDKAALPPIPAPPPVPVTQPATQVNLQEQALRDQKDTLLRVNSNLSRLGTKAANDEVKNNLEQIKSLDTQIQQLAVGGFNFEKVRSSLPKEFKERVDVVEELAKKGSLNGEQISLRLQSIQEKATEQQQKLTDYTNDVRRTAKELYPITPLTDLNEDQMRRLNLVIEQRAKARGAAGATKIDMGQKTVAIERAKAQVASETAAEGALAVAGDVRAIVDVLKPYQGGKFDELKASLGPYFPGTNLEKISSAAGIAEALRAKIAPTLRVPGSGATSDFEMKQFMAAIPSLSQYPQGRELLATYTQRFADRAVAAADIKAKMIEDGTYSLKSFQTELKNAGYERILTPEDLQNLNKFQAPAGTQNVTPSSPAVNRAFEKHKPR